MYLFTTVWRVVKVNIREVRESVKSIEKIVDSWVGEKNFRKFKYRCVSRNRGKCIFEHAYPEPDLNLNYKPSIIYIS